MQKVRGYDGKLIRQRIKLRGNISENWKTFYQNDDKFHDGKDFGYKKCFLPNANDKCIEYCDCRGPYLNVFVFIDYGRVPKLPVGTGPCAKLFKGDSCELYPEYPIQGTSPMSNHLNVFRHSIFRVLKP